LIHNQQIDLTPDRELRKNRYLMRKCLRPECPNILESSVHCLLRYCSATCKAIGQVRPNEPVFVDDPVAYINQRAENFGIVWISFGYRTAGTTHWWYYPGVAPLLLPIAALPPLPANAIYRILPFDHKINYDPSQEWFMQLTPKVYCKKTDGKRRMGA